MIYLRTAWRRILRDRGYSVVNIAGLALGLAVCILIVLFAIDEWGYDKYNDKADRIFRIVADLRFSGGSFQSIATPPLMGKTLVKDYPAVQSSVRIRRLRRDILVQVGTNSFIESNAVLADSTLFDIFSMPFIGGNPQKALVLPNSVVLSASTAERFFGTTDALGRVLHTDDDTTNYVVTGVMKDMPRQSHFHLTLIKSLHTSRDTGRQYWTNPFSSTYILVRPGTTPLDIDRMLSSIVDRYVQPEVMDLQHNSAADLARHGNSFCYYSMPLTSIHLYSNLDNEFEPNGQMLYVYIFLAIAGLILLIAFINFTNLATARGATQAREVGNLPNSVSPPRGFFKDASGMVTSTVLMGDWRIDADYIPTLQMKMVEGRNFSPLMHTDSGAVVLINETAARVLGLAHPLGKMIYTGPNPVEALTIVGVVKDFNAGSLRDPIDPIVFSLSNEDAAVSFRVDTKNIPALLANIRRAYDDFAGRTGEPFVYSFLDDDFNRLYQADERTSHLLTAFSLFAILIACFGLLGLVSYAAERRTKEIGIRKVLGARMGHVVLLLSKEFGYGVLLATVIACPVAWWVVQLWLRQFVFRTPLHWWIFTISPLVAAGLTLVVVGAKASRVWWSIRLIA